MQINLLYYSRSIVSSGGHGRGCRREINVIALEGRVAYVTATRECFLGQKRRDR